MNSKITMADTISAVVTNVPEKIGMSEDVMQVYDESSKRDGDLTVRFEIDPRLELRYNKSARVLKIRNKKTKW